MSKRKKKNQIPHASTNGSPRQDAAAAPVPIVIPPKPTMTPAQYEEISSNDPLPSYRPGLPIYSFHDETDAAFSFFADIESMLLCDAISAPLSFVRSPAAQAQIKVEGSSTPVCKYFIAEFERFWAEHLAKVQESGYAYGWMGGGCKYGNEGGKRILEGFHEYAPRDVQPLIWQNQIAGIQVSGENLQGAIRAFNGKEIPAIGFWYAHRPRNGSHYGQSQIRPAWKPWKRLTGRDGAEEVLDLAQYRYGTGFVVGRYPNKDLSAKHQTPGLVRQPARDIMQELVENAKAGGGIAMPSSVDQHGNKEWDIDFKTPSTNIPELMQVCEYLEKKCAKAIGVPPELMEAAETGSGFSGREIPLRAFLLAQQHVAEGIFHAWFHQIGQPLVWWNFGPHAWVRAKMIPLLQSYHESNQPPSGGSPPPGGAPSAPPAPAEAPEAAPVMPEAPAVAQSSPPVVGHPPFPNARIPYVGPRGGKGFRDGTGHVHYGTLATTSSAAFTLACQAMDDKDEKGLAKVLPDLTVEELDLLRRGVEAEKRFPVTLSTDSRKKQLLPSKPITFSTFNSADHPRGQPQNAGQFTKLADGTNVHFVPHEKQRDDETTVMVSPHKMTHDWPMGERTEVPGRRENFTAFLKKGVPIQASRASMGEDGSVSFDDGRHRFATLRDKGAHAVAVTVPQHQADAFTSRYAPESFSAEGWVADENAALHPAREHLRNAPTARERHEAMVAARKATREAMHAANHALPKEQRQGRKELRKAKRAAMRQAHLGVEAEHKQKSAAWKRQWKAVQQIVKGKVKELKKTTAERARALVGETLTESFNRLADQFPGGSVPQSLTAKKLLASLGSTFREMAEDIHSGTDSSLDDLVGPSAEMEDHDDIESAIGEATSHFNPKEMKETVDQYFGDDSDFESDLCSEISNSLPYREEASEDEQDAEFDRVQKIVQQIMPAIRKRLKLQLAPNPNPVTLSTDSLGHEHKGKGPGGGQFAPKGNDGSTAEATHESISDESSERLVKATEEYKRLGTQAPAFRAWFGDSKVVDEKGEPQSAENVNGEGKPITVYHGTPESFEQFSLDKSGSNSDSGYLGKGFYFTTHPDIAAFYSKIRASRKPTVIPAYLSIKNPFNWGKKTQGVRALVARGQRLPDAIHDKVIERTGFQFDPDVEPDFSKEKLLSAAVHSILIEMGHDGVVADVGGGTFSTPGKEYVAFEPSQIKAVDNVGTFDPDDARIHLSTDAH